MHLTISRFLGFFIFLSCLNLQAQAKQWDFATGYAESTYVTKLAHEFANAINEATNGDIEITVHSYGSKVSASKIKAATASGEIQMGERLLSAHQSENILYGFDSIPFITSDSNDVAKLWKVAKTTITKELAAEGLVLIYSVPFPFQGMYFKNKVNNASDIDGLNMRIYNTTGQQLATLLNMTPIHVESSKLVDTLKQNKLDGVLTSSLSGKSLELWKYLDYYYTFNVWAPRVYVFVNKQSWASLTPAQQELFLELGALIEQQGDALAQFTDLVNQQSLKNKGMRILSPPSSLSTKLQEIGKAMRKRWQQQAGKTGQQILDRYSQSK